MALAQANTQSAAVTKSATRRKSSASSGSASQNGSVISGIGSTGANGGILANAHEALPPRLDSGFKGALKAAFIPPQPGKQIKKTKAPLGKSFERTTPLPPDGRIEGGEVLPFDPRGEKATAGDGILPPSLEELSIQTSRIEGADGEPWPTSASSATSDEGGTPRSFVSESSDGRLLSSSPSDIDTRRSRGASVSSHLSAGPRSASIASYRSGSSGSSGSGNSPAGGSSTGSSSSHAPSIKFAPLPSSGRLKRANSITIGVAARSQLLHSQGSGRSAGGAGWQQQSLHFPGQHAGPQQATLQAAAGSNFYHPRHGDAVDLGDELRKGALKAWKKVRGGSGTGGAKAMVVGSGGDAVANLEASDVGTTTTAAATAAAAGAAGGKTPLLVASPTSEVGPGFATPRDGGATPRLASSPMLVPGSRPHSPPAALASLEADDAVRQQLAARHASTHHFAEGGQPESFALAMHADAHGVPPGSGSGTQTPRLERRVSTGGFLGAASLRGMQEQRRKEVLGLDDDDDDVVGAASSSRRDADDVEDLGLGVTTTRTSDAPPDLGVEPTSTGSASAASGVWKMLRLGAGGMFGSTTASGVKPGGEERDAQGEEAAVGKGAGGESVASAAKGERDGGVIDEEDGAEAAAAADEELERDEDEDDDEETREAQRLADEAIKSHSAQATMAAALEKVDRKRRL